MIPRIAALLLFLGSAVLAASPHLDGIDPAGLERGMDTQVTISGDRLGDARGLLFYKPGIAVVSMQLDPGGKLHAVLRVAPNCPLGEHDVRLWTASGISELLPIYVDPFPNIACSGSNHDIAHAQLAPANVTVSGVIRDEEIDYYALRARKGDRITAEVEGMRLGHDMFDPWAAILDAHGRQLASNDDNALLMLDPLVSMIAPADGTYLISIRESAWGGSPRSIYRLHIGDFPQPVVVYPPGGQLGQTVPVSFVGDAKGVISAMVQLPSTPGFFGAEAYQDGLYAPTPLLMRVSPFPNVLEIYPNNNMAHATPGPPPPVALNGIIRQPHDRGYFRFHATKGQVFDMTVYARQLRSPIDTVLEVWNAKGGRLASNDDFNGPDSYLRFNTPADGDYFVSIRDQQDRGGLTYTYRLEITPVTPQVSFTEPEMVRDSQERQTVVVPRGNRYATLLRVTNDGFDGDYTLNFPGLPPGVTVQTGSLAGQVMPVIFEADANAPTGAVLTDVLARPTDPNAHVGGGYAQTVDLVYGSPNQSVYLKTDIDRLAVSVANEAPCRIDLAPPDAPLVQDGQGNLTVTATRQPGFTGPINVSLLSVPPGVHSQPVVTIPAGQESVQMPLNAANDARPKTWQIAVIASADAGQGPVWVSSDLVPLTVGRPFLVGKLDRASAVQGQPVTITCHLQQMTPFDGTAHIHLMGLPPKVTAPDVDVPGTASEAVFNVSTDVSSPPGQHKDLFCEVTVVKDCVKIVANTAEGGVLRIDPFETKKEVAAQ
ncbi:MAG: PPC domain-containing protein [Chthoniobacteraceae bacterium]|jgi:hypothetical protein